MVVQQLVEVCDLDLQIIILGLQLLTVQTLQRDQAHIADRLCLYIAQVEAIHQVLLGIVVRITDDLDDFVDVILCDQQALQEMGALLCLAEIVTGAALQNLFLEVQILVNDLAQGQNTGLRLVIDQRQHIDREGSLHLGHREQTVEHDLRIGIALELDDDAHTGAVGLIADVRNAFQTLVLYQICHMLDQHTLIDLIRDLGNDDAGTVVAVLFKFGAGANRQTALTGRICGADACAAHDDALGREIGAVDMFHEVDELGLGIVNDTNAGVDDLAQVVRWDIGRHTDRDTRRAVDQQVRETGGQHTGLEAALIEVGIPVYGFLIDVAQHLGRHLVQACLGVTVSSRRVAIDRTEVAVTVNQRIAHGEILRQTNERVVNRSVAVGMILTKHVTDTGRRLLERLVRGQTALMHRIQDAAVNRFQTVAHIGQRTSYNNAHRVLDVGLFHLADQLGRDDMLIRI